MAPDRSPNALWFAAPVIIACATCGTDAGGVDPKTRYVGLGANHVAAHVPRLRVQ
jgi:hypothetical protein